VGNRATLSCVNVNVMKEMALIPRTRPPAGRPAGGARGPLNVLTTAAALAAALAACCGFAPAPGPVGTPSARATGTSLASCLGRAPARAGAGQAPALASVQFDGPSLGWVVGDRRILATSDGGRTWARQYRGPADLGGVDFIDSQHGWAAGRDTLLRTTDGGGTWTRVAEPCQGGLLAVHFASPSLGYAVMVSSRDQAATGGLATSATGGWLVRSTDGGLTWAVVESAPRDPQSACFANASDGYLGTPGRIWRTTDGGQNWGLALAEPRAAAGGPGRARDTPEIECAGAGAAWVLFLGQGAAMGNAPYLAYTSRNGREWHALFEDQYTESALRPGLRLPEGPGSYPGPFSAIGPGAAAFVGFTPPDGDGAAPLELVSGGGRTLAKVGDVSAVNEPFAAAFLSPARGWVVGENLRTGACSIEATADAGRTWATQYTTG